MTGTAVTLPIPVIREDAKQNIPVNEGMPIVDKSLVASPSRIAMRQRERQTLEDRMKNFDYKSSMAWKEIVIRYGADLTHGELRCVAEVIADNLAISLDREAKRRKNVLIKWFQENLEQIGPFLNKIKLIDSAGRPITNCF